MNYNKICELLYDLSTEDGDYIPLEFSRKNKRFLLKYADKAIKNYCKFIHKKDTSWIKRLMTLLVSFSAVYILIKSGVPLNRYVILYTMLIYTNLDFIFSRSLLSVIHRVYVLSSYRVVTKKALFKDYDYYLCYMGLSKSKDNVIYLISLDRVNKDKNSICNPKNLANPKLVLMKSGYESSIILDYIHSNNVKDLNWIEHEIFKDVEAEYFRYYARQQVLNEFDYQS